MELIFITENPFPGIRTLKIFDFVLDDDNTHYPIEVNDTRYELKMNNEGIWKVDGLSDDICEYVGGIIEGHEM